MTRMTNNIANTITNRIIDYKFKAPLEQADKARKDAADAFYKALYAPFAKAMEQLPDGAFDTSGSLRINGLLGERTVFFSENWRVFFKHQNYNGRISLAVTKSEAERGNNPIHKAAHIAIEAQEAYDLLKKERLKEFGALETTVRAYSSVEKLVAALPTTEAFTYGIENNVVKLPVVQVEAFNTRFGLPSDPELIKAQVEAVSSLGNKAF